MQGKVEPADIRLWRFVDRTAECWLWTGALDRHGYGAFRVNRRTVRAHRFAYQLVKGEIPDGLTLDHLCRTPACVRPDHLEPVTLAENKRRGMSPSAQNARKTHCKRGHEFTPENTGRVVRGRRCRTCHREDENRRYHEKVA